MALSLIFFFLGYMFLFKYSVKKLFFFEQEGILLVHSELHNIKRKTVDPTLVIAPY